MRAIQKLLIAILFIVAVLEAGLFFVVPEDLIVLHAISKQREKSHVIRFMPQWLARTKFDMLGYNSCYLASATGGKNSLVNFLVNAHGSGAYKGQTISLLERAIAQGCDLNAVSDFDGVAPLHAAVIAGDISMVDFLLKAGADLNVRVKRAGKASDGLNTYELSKLLVQNDASQPRLAITMMLGNVANK